MFEGFYPKLFSLVRFLRQDDDPVPDRGPSRTQAPLPDKIPLARYLSPPQPPPFFNPPGYQPRSYTPLHFLPIHAFNLLHGENPVSTEGEKQRLRDSALSHFASELLPAVREHFKEAAFIFIPPMTNIFPSDEAMNVPASVFGHGAVILGASRDHGKRVPHSLFTAYGENMPVNQPDWRMEVAIIIRRLYEALTDPLNPSFRQAKRFYLFGQSKGGLVAHTLSRLSRLHYDYAADTGRFAEEFYDVYPGLKELPPEIVKTVMRALRDEKLIVLGSPLEGGPQTLLAQLGDRYALDGAASYLHPEFLDQHYDLMGSLDETDHVLETDLPEEIIPAAPEKLHPVHLARWGLKTGINGATRLLAPGLKARGGDGFVPKYRRVKSKALQTREGHIHQIINPKIFSESLEEVVCKERAIPRVLRAKPAIVAHSIRLNRRRSGPWQLARHVRRASARLRKNLNRQRMAFSLLRSRPRSQLK